MGPFLHFHSVPSLCRVGPRKEPTVYDFRVTMVIHEFD